MTKLIATTSALAFLFFCTACNKKQKSAADATYVEAPQSLTITKGVFGSLPDGQQVDLYTLKNKNGMSMQVINYGGIITTLSVPDKNGTIEDIVLGYDSLSQYLKDSPYFGALVGRYGNRIAKGKFTLDDQTYTLAQNNNGEHLHGGLKGFDKVFWNIEEMDNDEGPALKLTYTSKDMEEGYPGNLDVEVRYVLTDANELKITYHATTDKKTILNLTQHTYFNLAGNARRDNLEHEVMIKADQFLPVTKTLIPTGKLQDVAGTPFDFRQPKAIGKQINDDDQQLKFGLGYDHCWVLSSTDSMKLAASLYEPTSGRYMEVHTTEPAIQFYSGNFLDGSNVGKGGVVYKYRYAVAMETEHYPDSPNQSAFPSVVLNPGDVYSTATTYSFSTK